MDRFEQYVLRNFAKNALDADASSRSKRPRAALANWLFENCELLGLAEPDIEEGKLDQNWGHVSRETWSAFKPLTARLRRNVRAPTPSGLERRLRWICETLDLNAVEADILKAMARAAMSKPVERLASAMEGSGGRAELNASGLVPLTGHSPYQVRQALHASRPLCLMGLLEDRHGGDFAASRIVLKIARLPSIDGSRLRGLLLGKAKRAALTWADFDHVGEPAALAERLLRSALDRRAVGINILLHGAPGTGKTEFVKTLAERIGAHAAFVGEVDEENGEPKRSERIAAFAIARSLAGRTGNTLLVIDEADDIFTGVDDEDGDAKIGSKVFMNRLVERTEAPTIWITNHPDRLGSAVLRRMALAVRFPAPGRLVRRRVIARIDKRRKLKLGSAALDQLARLEVAPAILDGAARVAQLTGGREDVVFTAALSVAQTLGQGQPPPALTGALAFDPRLSSADQDLAALASRAAHAGELAISFCLYGLPGTGKSAFARYVASSMGLDVVEKRASDLLSMWVGGTEKAIAHAFEEASDKKAMLIFDEADSLLRDRAGAKASWQVSQVNEMLTWMERHPFPVACTTNLMESLDPATLRRFLFKVRFLPMTAEQIADAFHRAFGIPAPSGILSLDPVAPGDFAVVSRKSRLLGVTEPLALAQMLVDEVRLKPNSGRTRIGF